MLLRGFSNILCAQEHYAFTYADRSSLLSDGWDFTALTSSGITRNTEQTSGALISFDQRIHPGILRIPVDIGDLWGNINNTRNTLFRDLPSGWTSIRLKIASFDPTQGNQQATLVAYQDDDNYVQISRTFEGFNRIMFTSEADGNASNLNFYAESATVNIFLRLDRDKETENITSYYSLDGLDWKEVGNVFRSLKNPRLAIETGASPAGFPNADIEWAEISTQPLPLVTDELIAHPGSMVFNIRHGEQTGKTRSIFISSAFGKVIRWKRSTDASWITADSDSGLTDGILKIGIDPSGLEEGIYKGDITIESHQSASGPVVIPVSLIINPDVPVKITAWRDGKDGAMSVSVDDGQPSGYNELNDNGFKGTYVTNGFFPPSFYTNYYNAGMELGSHLVNHPCSPVSTDLLISQEILPNILNLSASVPMPQNKIITLVWPCGFTNYREQAVASQYFLCARGYNINQLEESDPENFMNLKSFNSHEHIPFPPSDLKIMVDSAVLQHKWFNLVLHNMTNDDGAINYSHSENIWVAPIGSVIKYIMQRDRFVLNSYTESQDKITFNISRLAIQSSSFKNFEESIGPDDIITMQIDIDDNRLVESISVNGMKNPFRTKKINGNRILYFNISPDPDNFRTVELTYSIQPATEVSFSSGNLNFNTIVNKDPENQHLYILTNGPDMVSWSGSSNSSGQNWRLNITPNSGLLNDTITVSVNCNGLPVGDYYKTITITSPDDNFYPQDINVSLKINPSILHQNYPNPFNESTWIEYDLPENGNMTLEIYDSKGQKTETILNRYTESGNYKIEWRPHNYPSGIYYLLIKTKSYTGTIMMSFISR